MIVLILITIVIILFVYRKIWKPLSYWEKKGVPHEKPFLFFGNLAPNVFRVKSIADVIRDVYREFPKQRYYGFYQFLTPNLAIRDPELIKQITVKYFDHFTDHRTFVPPDMDPLWSKGLFATTGAKWRNLRVTMSPTFTTSKMKFMFSLISECAENFAEFFHKKSEDVLEVELKGIFTKFTNDAIATSTFGLKCDSLNEPNNVFYKLGHSLSNIFTGFRRFTIILYGLSPKLMKILDIRMFSEQVSNFFRGVVSQTMKLRRETGLVRPDLIHLMMQAQKGNLTIDKEDTKESNFAAVEEYLTQEKLDRLHISDDDIVAQAIVFFLGGFDTVAVMCADMGYELAVNQDVQRKLIEEVDKVFEESEGKPTYRDVMSMQYLDMVVSETLRKYPQAIFLDRIATKPFTIEPTEKDEKPFDLEVGDAILIPVYGIHHDPKHYPNPEKFDPERFNETNKHKINPYLYLPFGIGPRSCIGSRLALLECKVLFVHLLRKFMLSASPKTPIPFVLDPKNISLVPVGEFWVNLKKRQP